MDEDFDDVSYYSKPRLKLAAGPAKSEAEDSIGEPTQALKAGYCSVGVASLALGICTSGVLQFFAFWVSLAFLIGPFSPAKVTGGNCGVGLGGEVEFEEDDEEEEAVDMGQRKGSGSAASKERNGPVALSSKADTKGGSVSEVSKGGWTRGEWDSLRKMLVKFPRGTPQRWENVARGLGTKRSTEEVIAATKFMSDSSGNDPYAAFVAQLKAPQKENASPSTPEVLLPRSNGPASSSNGSAGGWTEDQERALLSAMKEFPKTDPLRWDKVAKAVPEHSKAECQKRITEMRDALRAKKAAGGTLQEADVDVL